MVRNGLPWEPMGAIVRDDRLALSLGAASTREGARADSGSAQGTVWGRRFPIGAPRLWEWSVGILYMSYAQKLCTGGIAE